MQVIGNINHISAFRRFCFVCFVCLFVLVQGFLLQTFKRFSSPWGNLWLNSSHSTDSITNSLGPFILLTLTLWNYTTHCQAWKPQNRYGHSSRWAGCKLFLCVSGQSLIIHTWMWTFMYQIFGRWRQVNYSGCVLLGWRKPGRKKERTSTIKYISTLHAVSEGWTQLNDDCICAG